MIKKLTGLVVVACFVVLAVGYARVDADHHGGEKEVLRFGMVIGLNPDVIDEYKRLHADENAGVRDLLSKYNMQNFNIFFTRSMGSGMNLGTTSMSAMITMATWPSLMRSPAIRRGSKCATPCNFRFQGKRAGRLWIGFTLTSDRMAARGIPFSFAAILI